MANITFHFFLCVFLSFAKIFFCIQLTQSSSDQLTKDKNKFLCENNEINFNKLVEEYERRLAEQVKLAKMDMLNELEAQIKVSNCNYFF